MLNNRVKDGDISSAHACKSLAEKLISDALLHLSIMPYYISVLHLSNTDISKYRHLSNTDVFNTDISLQCRYLFDTDVSLMQTPL